MTVLNVQRIPLKYVDSIVFIQQLDRHYYIIRSRFV